jgi:hypothetical protein
MAKFPMLSNWEGETMEATVIAALVTSTASLLAAGATGIYFNTRLERIKNKNAQTVAGYQLRLQEASTHRHLRLQALETLHNAASIAHSAARSLRANADIRADQEYELFTRTAAALQQLSTFFGQLKESERNVSLAREDVQKASAVQVEIMRMFFSLDLDENGKEEYKAKLDRCYKAVDFAYEDFKGYYEHLRDTTHLQSAA